MVRVGLFGTIVSAVAKGLVNVEFADQTLIGEEERDIIVRAKVTEGPAAVLLQIVDLNKFLSAPNGVNCDIDITDDISTKEYDRLIRRAKEEFNNQPEQKELEKSRMLDAPWRQIRYRQDAE
jgi:hypothetical protein